MPEQSSTDTHHWRVIEPPDMLNTSEWILEFPKGSIPRSFPYGLFEADTGMLVDAYQNPNEADYVAQRCNDPGYVPESSPAYPGAEDYYAHLIEYGLV